MRTLKTLTQLASLTLLVTALGGCSSASSEEDNAVDSTSADLSGNEGAAYKFFRAKGLSPDQAAGIVGNLIQESSVLPGAVQFGGGPGRGIAQWSVGGRWNHNSRDNVIWYAGTKHESAESLELQLEFVWYELQTFSGYGLSRLKGTRTLRDATIVFQNDFEGCGTCDESRRIQYAEQVLRAFGH